jgi:hypothetical protein
MMTSRPAVLRRMRDRARGAVRGVWRDERTGREVLRPVRRGARRYARGAERSTDAAGAGHWGAGRGRKAPELTVPSATSSARRHSRSSSTPRSGIYGWFNEGFATRDLKEAKALLEELA